MAKIFVTGATGYIGGDALYALLEKHSTLEPRITALVRSSDKGALIAQKYPKLRLVYGSLDDSDLLQKEAAAADLVLHFANADHEAAATALTAALAERASQGLPAYIVHTSGSGILAFEDLRANRFGVAPQPDAIAFSDSASGVSALVSLPDDALHRAVDKIVLASNEKGVTTAIVSPPTIIGRSRGPGNQRSFQWPWFAKAALQRGKSFYVGEGKNQWDYIHVQDLSNIYLAVTEAALDRIAGGGGGKATWNQEGYYLAASGDYVWGDVAEIVGQEGKTLGIFESADTDAVTKDGAEEITAWGSLLWGSNARGEAVRAKDLFGWEPKHKDWQAVLRETVQDEALALGLTKTHAQKAAGN